jgi:demethylspheroidene O-methyltransferase
MNANSAGQRQPGARANWHDRLLGWRDRWLCDYRFQRWVARFPLTRPVARRHARALFDLCAGFVYSQVLLSCVRLRVLELLRPGPLSLMQIASRLDLRAEAAETLLTAAAALDLIEQRRGQRWGLGPLGAALLGNTAVLRMIEHHPTLYEDLRDPVALLRDPRQRSQLSALWPYARHREPRDLDEAQIGAYTTLMSDTQALVAEEVLDGYPIAQHRCLLDVGGGDGTFLAAAAARAPQLKLLLFDLPAVALRAQARLTASGLAARVEIHGGDFMLGALPMGADLVTLIRVLHDHDDPAALSLLRAVRRALPAGGRVLLAEPMRDTPGALPGATAYFACYLRAMGQGKPRSATQIAGLLLAAGFARTRLHPTARPWQCALVTGTAI